MSKCDACKSDFTNPKDCIACTVCHGFFHSACTRLRNLTNLTALAGDKRKHWRCDRCRESMGEMEKSFTSFKDDIMKTFNEKMAEVLESVEMKLDEFTRKIEDVQKRVTNKINEMEKSVKFMSEQFEEHKKLVEENSLKTKQLEQNYPKLQKTVSQLKAENSQLNIELRRNNVMFHGIPFTKNENLAEIVQKIGKLIKADIEEQSLDFVFRLPIRNEKNPAPILCRFVTRNRRDAVFHAYRDTVKIQNDGAGVKLSSMNKNWISERCFIGEHIPRDLGDLLYEARQLAKEINFKFVWVRDYKIYMKKTESDRPIRITNYEQLDSLRDKQQQ